MLSLVCGRRPCLNKPLPFLLIFLVWWSYTPWFLSVSSSFPPGSPLVNQSPGPDEPSDSLASSPLFPPCLDHGGQLGSSPHPGPPSLPCSDTRAALTPHPAQNAARAPHPLRGPGQALLLQHRSLPNLVLPLPHPLWALGTVVGS